MNKVLSILIYSLVGASFFAPASSLAQPQTEDLCEIVKVSKDSDSWSHQVISGFCSLPGIVPYRSALIQWANIFNPLEYAHKNQVNSENKGLLTYFQEKILSDPTFERQLKAFSKRLQDNSILNSENVGLIYDWSEEAKLYPLHSRPSLIEQAGEGRYSSLKAGEVWNLALEAADQNPEKALDLIGACGSDDISARYLTFASPSARQEYEEVKFKVRSMEKKGFQILNGNNNIFEGPKVLLEAQKINDETISEMQEAGKIESISCSPWTIFVPQALGKDVDIPKNIKNKIINIQAPTKGGAYLPAKYYHVNMAAFSSCKLAALGVPSFFVKQYQSWFAWAYREVSLENQVDHFFQIYEKNKLLFEGQFGTINTSEKHKQFEVFFEKNLKEEYKRLMGHTAETFETTAKEITLPHLDRITGMILNFYKAGILFKQWSKPFTLFGFGFKYSDQFINGAPKNLLGPDPADKKFKPSYWSDEEYLEAKRKVATWLVDWEWTVAQHTAGAEFGANLCR